MFLLDAYIFEETVCVGAHFTGVLGVIQQTGFAYGTKTSMEKYLYVSLYSTMYMIFVCAYCLQHQLTSIKARQHVREL